MIEIVWTISDKRVYIGAIYFVVRSGLSPGRIYLLYYEN